MKGRFGTEFIFLHGEIVCEGELFLFFVAYMGKNVPGDQKMRNLAHVFGVDSDLYQE